MHNIWDGPIIRRFRLDPSEIPNIRTMPKLVARSWKPPGQRARFYEAFVPDPIADLSVSLSGRVQQLAERAAIEMARVDASMPVAWQPIARLLLRAEGLASSDIEGLRVTPRLLLEAAETATEGTARWVLGNLEALDFALTTTDRDLSISAVLEWHRRLMIQSPRPDQYVGKMRAEQGWIGGSSPLDAAYVPPPAGYVPDLMDDLVGFCNRTDLPAVVQAAIAHAQFEAVHPFGDGNGRTGRILVDWILRRRRVVERAIPPISPVIARRVDDYIVGLYRYREADFELWIGWFAQVCLEAAGLVAELISEVEALVEGWVGRLANTRSDATARKLLGVLAGTPLIDAGAAALAVGVSRRAALAALSHLESVGIVEGIVLAASTPGRPRRRWLATEVLELLSR